MTERLPKTAVVTRFSTALPIALLTLQLVASFSVVGALQGFRPDRVPDTPSYVKAPPLTSVQQALSHHRTFAYPLLLRTLARTGLGLHAVPWIHAASYFASVLLLWLGISRFSGDGWLALAATTPLAWSSMLYLFRRIQPDFLAAAATVVVVGSCFLIASRPLDWRLWVLFGVSVITAYQLRPAMIFLVVWAPVTAAFLRWIRHRPETRLSLRWAGGLALVALLPWLAFSALRAATVGHFGLVSFGGHNLSGIAASFVDEELLAELTAPEADIARDVLRVRQRRQWGAFTAVSSPMDAFEQHNKNVWRAARPAVERLYNRAQRKRVDDPGRPADDPGRPADEALASIALDPRPRPVVVDALLSGFGQATIRRRPWLYLRWVRESILYGFRQLVRQPWVRWPLVLLICSLPILLVRAGRPVPRSRRERTVLLALLAVGLSYFTMYLILEGAAKVELETASGERMLVGELSEGEIFGEMALINEVERTANVIATEETKVLSIDWDSLRRIRRIFPWISTQLFLNISRVLGTRLVQSNHELAEARKR